jgi:hypothetical protein
MAEAQSRLNENNRKQSSLTIEIREMNKQISYESKEKRLIELQLLELKKSYERERLARRIIMHEVKVHKESNDILNKALGAKSE